MGDQFRLIVSIVVGVAITSGFEAEARQPRKTPNQAPVSRVVDALKHEAEAKNKEREAMIARAKAIAGPVQKEENPDPFRNLVSLREEVVESDPEGNEDGIEMEVDEASQKRTVLAYDPRSFDTYLFRGFSNDTARRLRLDSKLERKIKIAEHNWVLTKVQVDKLRIAGRGDIKRFFDKVKDRRREFEIVRTDVDECRLFLLAMQPLCLDFQVGPFDSGSLFGKTLAAMLKRDNVVRRS